MQTTSVSFQGQKASPGLSFGPVYFLEHLDFKKEMSANLEKEFQAANEISNFEKAIARALTDISVLKTQMGSADPTKIEILEAHESLIDDPEVKEQAVLKISEENKFAVLAYGEVINSFKEMFANLEDTYLQQRVLDLEDISKRVLFYIINPEGSYAQITIEQPSIIVAKDLTPSEILGLDKSKVLGMVLIEGSAQSHTAILARSMEIPCVVGVHDLNKFNKATLQNLILDANKAKLLINPTASDLTAFNESVKKENEHKQFLASFKGKATITKAGKHIPLGANISGPQDCDSVINNDAELVGLYRTEFLFLDRTAAPTEKEQYDTFVEVFKKLGSKRIIVRTLDIGGDKEAPYLKVAKEENPFLGVRGIRLCLQNPDLFKTQLRALLRASHYCSDLGIMFPMVSTMEEILEAKKIVAQIKAELAADNIQIGSKIDLGVMMEVPSLAWILKEVAAEVSFISIGTNDLFQYSNACDRMNSGLKSISSPTHPGFLRFLKFIVSEAKANNLHVGVCGSIAHHPEIMPYLINIGVDDLSMTAQHILEARAKISSH